MIKSIGVTGSRFGPNENQAVPLQTTIANTFEAGMVFHHGCCTGVDEFAVVIARNIGYHVIAHPPMNRLYLSHLAMNLSQEIRDPDEYLIRNRRIVDECNVLIAVPLTTHEVLRSGTWATIRYATIVMRKTTLITPDGEVLDGC